MQYNIVKPHAIAALCGSDAYLNLRGQVRFYQQRNCVLIEVNIHGLPDTETDFFGFHIHAGDSCTGSDFSASGSHFSATDSPHPLHSGDLPVLISCRGKAYIMVATCRFCVEDIIGRTVIMHDMADDFNTQPSGNAGSKIACGVIRKV